MDFFLFFFCLVFAMPLFTSVYMCFVVTCCERADLLALVCGVLLSLSLSHWYPWSGVVLNLSIPDVCTLTYFDKNTNTFLNSCWFIFSKYVHCDIRFQ